MEAEKNLSVAERLFLYICLKKGGELIINYQLEYYEKNLISSICIRCLSVYGYMISIKHEEIV